MTNQKIFLELDGEKFQISNALIGATMVKEGKPFSVYAGNLDIADFGLALLHILRATIKINVEEQGLPLSTSKEFIEFTLKTALQLEKNRMNDFTKTSGMSDFVKKYLDSQL